MSSSTKNQANAFVADASVAINLNATARAREILGALPGRVVVTTNALAELERGRHRGHDDAALLRNLIALDLIQLVSLDGDHCREVYASLISGGASETLDDGEAATLAYAAEAGAVALIDERKARRIALERFPSLVFRNTVDILFDPKVKAVLGEEGRAQAVLNGLLQARMQVPPAYAAAIIELIGVERARSCATLARHLRIRHLVHEVDERR